MANVSGDSASPAVAAVKGENTSGVLGADGVLGISNAGNGVHGKSVTSFGVLGESTSGRGVVATSDTDYGLRAASRTSAGLRASSVEGRGVEGWATKAEGVVGISTNGNGVWGQTDGTGIGVLGTSKGGAGVAGTSETNSGVVGRSKSGRGMEGWSETSYGASGDSRASAGVRGTSVQGNGIEGWSTTGTGVFATSSSGVAVYGKGGRLAGFFEGDVEVTGDIRLSNADCAEDFDIAEASASEPGTVMVLGDEGALHESQQPYDKRVAGVVSGAGTYKPGLVLDRQATRLGRKPIALMGKVFCKVDARYAAIEIGDLLTTSASPGHAMKASEPQKAFGAVIGKALRPLKEGQGLIPILIALQ